MTATDNLDRWSVPCLAKYLLSSIESVVISPYGHPVLPMHSMITFVVRSHMSRIIFAPFIIRRDAEIQQQNKASSTSVLTE